MALSRYRLEIHRERDTLVLTFTWEGGAKRVSFPVDKTEAARLGAVFREFCAHLEQVKTADSRVGAPLLWTPGQPFTPNKPGGA